MWSDIELARVRRAQRIAVLGPCGAGKSFMARALGERLGLPVVHLDAEYWQPGWREPDAGAWATRAAAIRAEQRWIIDGNYLDSLDARLDRADVAVVLDYRRRVHVPRMLWRVASTYGRVRSDMAEGCPEQVDLEFFRYTWTYRKARLPRIIRAVSNRGPRLLAVTLGHPNEAQRWLTALDAMGRESGRSAEVKGRGSLR